MLKIRFRTIADIRVCSRALTGILAVMALFLAQPVLGAPKPADNPTEFEIPLRELQRVVKKNTVKKTPKTGMQKKSSLPLTATKPPLRALEPDSWAVLEAVRVVDEGIRLDIDGLSQVITLLLEPANRKVVLQLAGVRYPAGTTRIPLGTFDLVEARIGRHPDGTWVVLDSSSSTLPPFDVLQDSDGITLKIIAADQSTESTDHSEQALLLTREKAATAGKHILTPLILEDPSESDLDEPDIQDDPPVAPEAPATGSPTIEEGTAIISHDPYSYVVTGKQTSILAVISSDVDVDAVYCKVRVTEESAVTVTMKLVDGTQYTYEGLLPEPAAGSQFLRYSIVAVDLGGKQTTSREFAIPVKPSSVVPGWQR
jgi:hypothetical protein